MRYEQIIIVVVCFFFFTKITYHIVIIILYRIESNWRDRSLVSTLNKLHERGIETVAFLMATA